MKCKVGDRVRFLNDVGGGKVTRIVKNTVYVLDNDGFEVPAMLSDIIVVNQSTESKYGGVSDPGNHAEQDTTPDKADSNIVGNEEPSDLEDLAALDFLDDDKDSEGDMLGIHLAFVPTDQSKMVDSSQELYIINDSPYRTFYSISRWEGSLVKPIRAGFLYPDSKEMVKEFPRESLNADVTLNIQCLFFKNRDYAPQQPEYYDLRINPTKFFRAGSYAENDFFEERAILYSIADTQKEAILKTLTNSNIDKVIEQKDSVTKPPVKKVEPEVEEVDLHIQELVDNPNDYTPGQIIEMQLARFKVTLEGGINSKARKMVFIHGVGNGKLKHELRKELDRNYPKLRYQDASFKEYGYGATLVYLRTGK
jgi:hypothetical protein